MIIQQPFYSLLWGAYRIRTTKLIALLYDTRLSYARVGGDKISMSLFYNGQDSS